MSTPISLSCLMPTRGRHALLPAAVANFLAQDFVDAELLIVSEDGLPDSLRGALAGGRVRHVPCPAGLSLGAKRNFACAVAHGELLAHWDDDDWYAADRLGRQVRALLAQPGKALCGSSRVYFRELDGARAWEYRYQGSRRPWLCGATLLYRRAFWAAHPFPDQSIGEDNQFVWSAHAAEVLDFDDPALCIASVHAGNSSHKDTGNAWWTPFERSAIDALIGHCRPAPAAGTHALLVLAGGIGDLLRWASLIPALNAAGHVVDLLIAADYGDSCELFAGAPGVDRVWPADPAADHWPAVDQAPYALAVFAYWATPFAARLPAVGQKILADGQLWRTAGDPGCSAAIAQQLGWQGPLPPPPLAPTLRGGDDGIAAGTLAIHAGCKAGWPWKKWHGYGELAGHFTNVLRVGTTADDDVSGTYFATPLRWPAHVHDATGPRSLRDTARLIGQCTALVANDSGLMHLAAALGVPTLGLFGLTSPAREAMPWPALHTLSGGLACEPACRTQPWGRRDCAQHLECLKRLAPARVAAKLCELAPGLLPNSRQRTAPAALPDSAPSGERGPTSPPPPPPALPLAIRLSGGFGDLLIAGRLIELLWRLSGFGQVVTYNDRPDLAELALGRRGLLSASRPLREWPAARGWRVEITQFVRFLDPPEQWHASHPAIAELISRANRRLASVRGLVDRHPQLDGFWARLNQMAGRQRGDAPAWSAALDQPGSASAAGLPAAILGHQAPLVMALDEADAAARLRLAASGRHWITVHDGFDTNLQVGPGQAVKCWPLEHWQQLIADLRKAQPALRIVQIGGPTSRPIPGVDDCLVGSLRLGEALWLLQGAELHIDGESGLVHAAHALGTPAVVLFGPTDPGFFGYADNVNLAATVCSPCWWSTPDWMTRCPRGLAQPVCMSAITPATVLDAALARLDRHSPPAAATWRPLRSALWSGDAQPGEQGVIAEMRAYAGLRDEPDGHAHGPATGCHLHASKQWEYAFALAALGIGAGGADGPPLRIADLGCGRGALAPWLAAQGHAVSGYDSNFAWDGRTDAARRFLDWATAAGLAARPASLYALPARDGSADAGFDAVLLISVLQHLAQPALAIREASRILKPGGRLVLSFDLAAEPEAFEDSRHRRSVVSPARLAAWLGLAAGQLGLGTAAIRQSAAAVQRAGVAGLPPGLTIGGMSLLKAAPEPPDQAPGRRPGEATAATGD